MNRQCYEIKVYYAFYLQNVQISQIFKGIQTLEYRIIIICRQL